MCLAGRGVALDDGIEAETRLQECVNHLIAHFKTFLTDAGTHGNLNLAKVCIQSAHFLYHFLGNASNGASPSGMSYRNNALLDIGKDDGHAVGRVHADDNSLERCHQGIHALECGLLLIYVEHSILFVDDSYTARMGLPRHYQVVEVHAQLHGQRQSRVKHPQRIIAHIVAQVHTRVSITPIHLTANCRERLYALDRRHKIQMQKFHHVYKGSKNSVSIRHESAKMKYLCTMTLNTATIVNYKNIAEARLEFSPKLNCLIGNNGQGKTNVLDAIYYLSMCRSFASASDNSAVIRHGEAYMMLQGHYTRNETPVEISVALQRGKRKVMRRDGKEYQRLSQHIGLLPVVMVSPMDWDLVRGSGEERRRFMDLIISQNDSEYLDALIRYNKAVEQRNAMIKQEMRDPLLYETVEQAMAMHATLVHKRRSQWVEQFLPIFMHYYSAVAGEGETVSLHYKSHLNDASMLEHLAATRERDLIIGHTTRGIHRDDLELMLDGHSMRQTGSQGQCKTYTIALRFAQFDFLKGNNPAVPILLLDDIFDKLDASRVERIVDVVSSDRFGQIFITDTNRTHLDEIVARHGGGHCLMHVENGAVTILKGGEQS